MIETAQLLGWIAALFVVASFQGRNLQQLVVLQLIGYGFLALHFSLLGAFTGAVMTLIGIARLLLALVLRHRPRLRPLYLLFIPLILLACWSTAQGLESLLPAIGYLLGTFAVYQQDMLRTRMLFLAAHPFWLVYNMLVGSHGGVAMELVNITSSTVAVHRHRRMMKENEGRQGDQQPSLPALSSRLSPKHEQR